MIKKMYLVLVICFLSFIVLACNETKDDDKQNEVKEYTVTFVVDGSETIVKAKEGEKVSKPIDPVKDGYQFIGWYLGSEEYTFNNVCHLSLPICLIYLSIYCTLIEIECMVCTRKIGCLILCFLLSCSV